MTAQAKKERLARIKARRHFWLWVEGRLYASNQPETGGPWIDKWLPNDCGAIWPPGQHALAGTPKADYHPDRRTFGPWTRSPSWAPSFISASISLEVPDEAAHPI